MLGTVDTASGSSSQAERPTQSASVERGSSTPPRAKFAPWTLDRIYAMFPRLAERKGNGGSQLSGGEQQMLAIGRGLMAEPRLLILDEPSLGLSPLLVEEMFALIARLKQDGLAVLLVEQNAQQALSRSDRAYILETGRVTREGVARELLSDTSIRAAYLGVA